MFVAGCFQCRDNSPRVFWHGLPSGFSSPSASSTPPSLTSSGSSVSISVTSTACSSAVYLIWSEGQRHGRCVGLQVFLVRGVLSYDFYSTFFDIFRFFCEYRHNFHWMLVCRLARLEWGTETGRVCRFTGLPGAVCIELWLVFHLLWHLQVLLWV